MTGATPSQTVGPYFKIGMTRLYATDLAARGVKGEHISIEGRVLDANGEPVPDAMIEIWQADGEGRYCTQEYDTENPGFTGFGRTPTDENGFFQFKTVKPGRVTALDGSSQAPHINVAVFMRGLLRHLVTRIYFEGDPMNENDQVLRLVPHARRNTLYATAASPGHSTFTWNVKLQGEQETVFFDW
jgi:protocatechuate 3,4-dioxygenase, alpha subunit